MSASPCPSLEPAGWLEEACLLEDRILDQARRTPAGEVVWPRLGWNLYDGVTGVVLFLAALERVEPRDGRRDCVLSALAPLRRRLGELDANPGGFTGLGGLIYSFTLLGRWLGEPELIGEADGVAALVTPERILADEALDVMSGCAGAALALLALGQDAAVERAVTCGERLLARRVASDGGPRAWPAKGLPPRCGFAHGAAGIAFCLTRLYERTGDARFRQAAEEGVAFERLHYDAEHGNWPLLGVPDRRFMVGWCGGAPGVALGRLGMLAVGGELLRQDLRAALKTTADLSIPAVDSLCCGDVGRAEVLLRAWQILAEEPLFEAAETIASQVVSRGYDPLPPSFFKGAAGLGYTLLRLSRPSLLPCVLALEATP